MADHSHTRIVSLVPSLTELLFDLGLDDSIVGRTRFCIRPENKVKDIPIIGGTKSLHIDKILSLEPDLIIANHEENMKEHIEELQKYCDIFLTDIASIEDALITISELGRKLGAESKAEGLIVEIQDKLKRRPHKKPVRTAYFIWRNPWMSVGRDTYIHNVMTHWGLHNIFSDRNRYPEINLEELKKYKPELILLSSEPFPFKADHAREIHDYCHSCKIEFVDGQWFSWYGSRMEHSFAALNEWRKGL